MPTMTRNRKSVEPTVELQSTGSDTAVSPSPSPSPSPSSASSPSLQYQALDLAITVIGIYVCYIYYAVLQEKLATQSGGGDTLIPPLFLMLVQCVCNSAFIYPIMMWKDRQRTLSPNSQAIKEHGPRTCQMKNIHYAVLAFSYLAGMQTSYIALQHINYPTQVLIKSLKMLPLVVLGTLVYGTRYSTVEYFAVSLITLGIWAFFAFASVKPGSASTSDVESPQSTLVGILLSMVSLTCDGITGSGQDFYCAKYRPTGELLMYKMNMWAVLELLVACFLLTSQGLLGLTYLSLHPESLWTLLLFGLVSAAGQCFIFHCVTRFGALPLSITTSTRKFFTILASVFYFGHSLNVKQWAAVLAVFVGLGVDIGKKAWSKRGGGSGSKKNHAAVNEDASSDSTSNAKKAA